MRYGLFTLLLCFFFKTVNAENITVYRWMDKNRIVHFSQNQPPQSNFIELYMSRPHHNAPAPTEQATKKTTQENKTASISKSKKCLAAQSNLNTLKSFDHIQYKTATGEQKLLTDKEKQEQLTLNTKQVALNCNK